MSELTLGELAVKAVDVLKRPKFVNLGVEESYHDPESFKNSKLLELFHGTEIRRLGDMEFEEIQTHLGLRLRSLTINRGGGYEDHPLHKDVSWRSLVGYMNDFLISVYSDNFDRAAVTLGFSHQDISLPYIDQKLITLLIDTDGKNQFGFARENLGELKMWKVGQDRSLLKPEERDYVDAVNSQMRELQIILRELRDSTSYKSSTIFGVDFSSYRRIKTHEEDWKQQPNANLLSYYDLLIPELPPEYTTPSLKYVTNRLEEAKKTMITKLQGVTTSN